jgi:acyl-CoA thioesterase-1
MLSVRSRLGILKSTPSDLVTFVRLVVLLLPLVVNTACEEKTHAVPQSLPQRSASGTSATATSHAVEEHEPKVVFLGDSITAGLHLDADEAYPAVVERMLRAQGLPFRLANAGVSGDTSAGGLARLPWILKQKPTIVVVELGANDGLRGVPIASVNANLRAILLKLKDNGAMTLLLGMRLPTNYGAEYTDAFYALYPRLAEELGIPLVPWFMEGVAGIAALNLPDGLHPTAEGHRLLAQRVAKSLAPLVAAAHKAEHTSAP